MGDGNSVDAWQLVIALYAALVATAALLWNILRGYQQIVVALIPFVKFYGDKEGNYEPREQSVAIFIVNHGRHPIKIESVGFILSNGKEVLIDPFFQRLPLPMTLAGNENCRFGLEVETVRRIGASNISMIKYVYAEDAALKKHKDKITKEMGNLLYAIVAS